MRSVSLFMRRITRIRTIGRVFPYHQGFSTEKVEVGIIVPMLFAMIENRSVLTPLIANQLIKYIFA